jgi:hypothetical protein
MVAAGHDECSCGYDDVEGKAQAAWDALKADNERLREALGDAPDTNSSGGGNATAAADRGVRTTPSEAAVIDAGNREAAASPDAALESVEREA